MERKYYRGGSKSPTLEETFNKSRKSAPPPSAHFGSQGTWGKGNQRGLMPVPDFRLPRNPYSNTSWTRPRGGGRVGDVDERRSVLDKRNPFPSTYRESETDLEFARFLQSEHQREVTPAHYPAPQRPRGEWGRGGGGVYSGTHFEQERRLPYSPMKGQEKGRSQKESLEFEILSQFIEPKSSAKGKKEKETEKSKDESFVERIALELTKNQQIAQILGASPIPPQHPPTPQGSSSGTAMVAVPSKWHIELPYVVIVSLVTMLGGFLIAFFFQKGEEDEEEENEEEDRERGGKRSTTSRRTGTRGEREEERKRQRNKTGRRTGPPQLTQKTSGGRGEGREVERRRRDERGDVNEREYKERSRKAPSKMDQAIDKLLQTEDPKLTPEQIFASNFSLEEAAEHFGTESSHSQEKENQVMVVDEEVQTGEKEQESEEPDLSHHSMQDLLIGKQLGDQYCIAEIERRDEQNQTEIL